MTRRILVALALSAAAVACWAIGRAWHTVVMSGIVLTAGIAGAVVIIAALCWAAHLERRDRLRIRHPEDELAARDRSAT